MTWHPVDSTRAGALSDARRQLHHAAQMATAAGISYLPPRSDDSHTNLEWVDRHGALESNPVPASRGTLRVGVRVGDLTLLLIREEDISELPLRGQSMDQAASWLRERLAAAGLDGDRYTLKRHYQIPPHPVAGGARFSAADADLTQLEKWFSNGAAALEAVRRANREASEVRCWPHHFDIATLITIGASASVGVGLEPGDAYYSEPYFYVNAHPQPSVDRLTATLAGKGVWHTREWIGAVLPGSRVVPDGAAQEGQVSAFLASAVAACRTLVTPE